LAFGGLFASEDAYFLREGSPPTKRGTCSLTAVRSRSPAHKTKSIRLNRKPLLDLGLMAAASYRYHPVSDLEPVAAEASSYRDAALECMKILRSVEVFMSRTADPRLAWVAVSCTIGLTSTSKLTEAEVARQIGVT